MNTVSISLTRDQVGMVDSWTQTKGYANRSEFFRALLRWLFAEPAVLDKAAGLEFAEFKKQPLSEVEKVLHGSGKWSKKDIRGLIAGLKGSSLYAHS